jgi:hypothetical protein
MRRASFVLGVALGLLLVAAPASAFAHDRVQNPVLHTVLDVLTLLAVTAPLLTARLWGRAHRGWLLALIAVVQAPVAVIGFVPVADPRLHVLAVAVAALLTGFSLSYVRRVAPTVAPARSSADPTRGVDRANRVDR